ncbi:MAG: hypothetical protein H6668_13220 [Ardenticatenaceae bacterium]|nr:hypothetical protein [Ardenticatenaceae bacterium]
MAMSPRYLARNHRPRRFWGNEGGTTRDEVRGVASVAVIPPLQCVGYGKRFGMMRYMIRTKHRRRSIRLPEWDYRAPGAYL